jgi:hypothetical protein
MNGGIEYYNFGWEDMTAPTLPLMLDIVRVASSVLERGGKIAVHCHAVSKHMVIIIQVAFHLHFLKKSFD